VGVWGLLLGGVGRILLVRSSEAVKKWRDGFLVHIHTHVNDGSNGFRTRRTYVLSFPSVAVVRVRFNVASSTCT
jgi:hypothetical protein